MQCEVCRHTLFHTREGKITTSMTLFELDWLNASATCRVWARCGYIHRFLPDN